MDHFRVGSPKFVFDYSPIKNHDHALLIVDLVETPSPEHSWDEWLSHLQRAGDLVSARVIDREYEFWQNASDPLEFTANGRDVPSERLYVDPVFGDHLIDISGNPGRRVLRDGFVEAVGSPMWLSDLFFLRTGASRRDVLESELLLQKEEVEGLLRFEATLGQFQQPVGKEGEAQESLRRLLFPS